MGRFKNENVAQKEIVPSRGAKTSPTQEGSLGKHPRSKTDDHRSITEVSDEELIHLQTVPISEFSRDSAAFSLSPERQRPTQPESVTGLPSSATASEENLTKSDVGSEAPLILPQSSRDSLIQTMGQEPSKRQPRTIPKNIMNEDPQEFMQRFRQVESEITGNCMPWSEHVYYKLFLDTEGRLATLMVLKCEITYVDVFTDVEHVLYRSRFIGGKADGVAQIFVYDLMKVPWEEKIPKSQAIELNIDIVISSSPIHTCSETLLNLIKLEKAYLKHRNFDGQLNVTIRFAHALGWDVKDDETRNRIHDGLRQLYREGVNLEVMSADAVLEEMRVDEIVISDEERVRHHIAGRSAWTIPPMSFKTYDGEAEESHEDVPDTDDHQDNDQGQTSHASTSSMPPKGASHSSTRYRHRSAESAMQTMDDGYYVYLHSSLWRILGGTKRTKSVLEQTAEDE